MPYLKEYKQKKTAVTQLTYTSGDICKNIYAFNIIIIRLTYLLEVLICDTKASQTIIHPEQIQIYHNQSGFLD